MGYSADSAGAVYDCSPIRHLTREAIDRAKTIVCMERRHANAVLALAPHRGEHIQVWNIPDDFDYCQPELVELISKMLPPRQYANHR
jgi:predicted protein tyrosine phosphatase